MLSGYCNFCNNHFLSYALLLSNRFYYLLLLFPTLSYYSIAKYHFFIRHLILMPKRI